MGIWMSLNVGAVALTVVALSWLLVVYVQNLQQVLSRFTLGLTLFAGALWFQAAVQIYFFATMMPLYTVGVDKLIFVQNILALVASTTLLSVTLRPVGFGRAEPDVA
jgi:hypothetical protein